MEENEQKSIQALDRLVRAIDYAYHHPGRLMLRGFLIGLASGLGATVGAAIILALLGFVLRELGGLPVIGDWLQSAGQSINQRID